jgi:hypothetical protein
MMSKRDTGSSNEQPVAIWYHTPMLTPTCFLVFAPTGTISTSGQWGAVRHQIDDKKGRHRGAPSVKTGI